MLTIGQLTSQIWIFDGAMGTMLQQQGLTPSECPEYWNIQHPERIAAIHNAYIRAGAQIIETNSFGANAIKLQHYQLHAKAYELNYAAAQIARRSAGDLVLVAGAVGPCGQFLQPIGNLSFDEAFRVFSEQIAGLRDGGADLILIETMSDIQEARAALLAAKQSCSLPVICQMTFDSNQHTLTGTDPMTAATILESMGADVIGANCSGGPVELLPVVKALSCATNLPISIQPNAGMPEYHDGHTQYLQTPELMAQYTAKFIAAGASLIGGCCGTTPQHIQSIAAACTGMKPIKRNLPAITRVCSRTQTVAIGTGFPTVVIGERINPTGRKILREELATGNLATVKQDAFKQVRAGAHILDINMGVPGVDEAGLMTNAILELQQLVQVPFAIDTTNPEALEAGLKAYAGKALINSVTAEPARMDVILPLAKKYGAAVLGLPITPTGIAKTATERIVAAQTILTQGLHYGLPKQDLLMDGLVLTAAAEQDGAIETLKSLQRYRDELQIPSVLGLSNISYGLPNRPLLNASFLAMALACGLNAPILNLYDEQILNTLAASAVLLNHDKHAARFIQQYTNANRTSSSTNNPTENLTILQLLTQCVAQGNKDIIDPLIQQAIQEQHEVTTIIENGLVPGMTDIGQRYKNGTAFLPQVMLSAETMRAAFSLLKDRLPQQQSCHQRIIVLATVQGDIHDLGKNIVAALLENYGFRVIDLGKDVPAQQIIDCAKDHHADLIGLSALMTTTMPEMKNVIQLAHAAKLDAKFIIGGAVVTQGYADDIHADAYAQDGLDAVDKAKSLLNIR